MEAIHGFTQDGADVQCIIDQDRKIVYVEYTGNGLSLKFDFHPDFPGVAKQFFQALCHVRRIETE